MECEKSCPSARCAPGATLIGVLGQDGRIDHLKTPLVIDQDFVDRAEAVGAPETRLRFASKCQTSGCSQWTGSRCGVIDRVLKIMEAPDAPPKAEALPPCVIRATCRWHAQSGDDACLSCAYVVTDTRQPAE